MVFSEVDFTGTSLDALSDTAKVASLVTNLRRKALYGSISAVLLGALIAGTSITQAAQLEEIVITAQKRAQSANDVGLTINAIGDEALEAAGVTDVSDLVRVSPGLNVGQTTGGFKVFSIRGINFNAVQISAAPTVTAYLDEAPLPYATMWGGLLLDIDHVEVLKGPQGTLFGQNATGGSISVISAKPTDELSGGAMMEVDEFDRVLFQGHLSGALTDTLRGRIALSTEQGGAWQEGYVTTNKEYGDIDKFTGRIVLDWTPTEDLKFALSLNGFRDKGEPIGYQFNSYIPQVPAAALPAFNAWPAASEARDAERDSDTPNTNDNYTYQTVLRAEWDFAEHMQLTSITNYVKSEFDTLYDYDATSIKGLNIETVGKAETFTQELRLSGDLESAKLHYILGAFYQDDNLLDEEPVENFHNYSGLPPNTSISLRYPQTNRAYAFFANGDLELTPDLTLTAGARYTKNRQTINGCFSGEDPGIVGLFEFISTLVRTGAGLSAPAPGTFALGECIGLDDTVAPTDPGYFLPNSVDLKQTEENVSWRIGLNYNLNEDTLLYMLISRGYKAGTFNVGNATSLSNIDPVDQEELTSYELGIKAEFLDRSLRANVSAFHYDYKDKQFSTYVPRPPFGANNILVNIPDSSVDGIDLELTASLFDDLTLHVATTYINTEITKFQGFDISLNPVDFSGNEFNFAPKWSATFDAIYRPALTDTLDGVFGINGVYNDETNSDLSQSENLHIPSYTVINAKAGVESSSGWRAYVWVRNLNDKYYWTTTSAPGDWTNKLAGPPRTYGLTVGYDF